MKIRLLPIITFVVITAGTACAADPFDGTWKLDVNRSQFNTSPAPRSETITIEMQENGMKLVADRVDADGKTLQGGFFAKFNEMDYPYTITSPLGTIAQRRVHDDTIVSVSKNNGVRVSTVRYVVSPDGRTMTGVERGKDANGERVKSIYIYERQPISSARANE
jgi:hypothetical protein